MYSIWPVTNLHSSPWCMACVSGDTSYTLHFDSGDTSYTFPLIVSFQDLEPECSSLVLYDLLRLTVCGYILRLTVCGYILRLTVCGYILRLTVCGYILRLTVCGYILRLTVCGYIRMYVCKICYSQTLLVSTWVSKYSCLVSTWVSEYSWLVSTWVSEYSWVVSTPCSVPTSCNTIG